MSKISKEALTAAIFGQESTSGAADTSKPNYAGARGPMQVIEPTFDALKNKGLIPKEYKWDNPKHTKAAGEALVGYLHDKYEGDPRKVAAAYYSGEKAVRADGSIADFRDKKNAKAPTTHGYVADIERRLGMAGVKAEPVSSGNAEMRPLESVPKTQWGWDLQMPDRFQKPEKMPKAAPEQIVAPFPEMGNEGPDRNAAIAGQEAVLRKEAAAREDFSFLDMAKNKAIDEGFGNVVKWMVREEYEPDPNYLQDPKVLDGLTEQQREFMRQATSKQHEESIGMEIAEEQAREEQNAQRGLGANMLASALAGAPFDYVTGMAAYRAFRLAGAASYQLAEQGRRGAAIASGTAEAAAGAGLASGVSNAFDKTSSITDVGIDMAGSAVLGGLLNIPGVMATSGHHAATAEMEALGREAARRGLEVRQRALANVGDNAPEHMLQAEIKRLEAEDLRAKLTATEAPLRGDRKLIDEDPTLRPDTPEPKVEETPLPKIDAASLSDKDMKEEVPPPPPFDTMGYKSADPEWHKRNDPKTRLWLAAYDPGWKALINNIEGTSLEAVNATFKRPGFLGLPRMMGDVTMTPVVNAVRDIVKQMIPEARVVLGLVDNFPTAPSADGMVISAGKTHFIGIKKSGSITQSMQTAIHEVGHAVFHMRSADIPPALLNRMAEQHREFLLAYKAGTASGRFKRFAEGSVNVTDDGKTMKGALPRDGKQDEYIASFDEYTAEAFVRWVQRQARDEARTLSLDKGVIGNLKAAWEAIKELWTKARAKGYLPDDTPFDEFFQRVLDKSLGQAEEVAATMMRVTDEAASANRTVAAMDIANDPVVQRNGLGFLPTATPTQQAEVKALAALYRKAAALLKPTDEKRLSWLMDTAVFKGGQSLSNTLLRSKNPIARLFGQEILESPSGAGGRQDNAAIGKYMMQQKLLGNTLNEVQGHYVAYRTSMGGSVKEDAFGGKTWEGWNRRVAAELEARGVGKTSVESHPAVKLAADSLELAYERMRVAQIDSKTIGWASLPETSKGYMPHKISPERFINATKAQKEALHEALRDQFISIEGFDFTFAQQLASKYMDRVHTRAMGGFDAPIGIHQVGAADIVEEALEQMGMGREQITAMMRKYMAGGMGHTKKRLALDLNRPYSTEDGDFRLLDLFETDQFSLLRSQAMRVSGEVALARHGIMGRPGLKLMRRAMEFGEDGQKATAKELEAFDAAAAEFLGQPFGTQNKFLDRVMQVNSLARLGGMGFTQFAEAINGIFHVGATRTLASIGSFGRLRDEIKALARGEVVDNPIIGSLERYGGAEFGTEPYKTVFPFDNQSLQYQTYGKETLGVSDRLLRGGSFVQGKLSLWRTIHSTQQRGMAEQVVRKAAQFLKDGGNDVALRDMGVTDELMVKLRRELGNIAEFDGNGRLTNFDITRAEDRDAAYAFTQAVHRGVSQIIQGTFIGEKGLWAHDGIMRLMTQFRTFSLTSVEKQWGRQVGNVGTAKALGMMLGAMSMAAPIYMARTYLASVGREDQQEYLEKQLSPAQIARASMNYIAMSGLAGDFLDATTALTGMGEMTGGRSGASSRFVGNMVAPSLGLVDDVWKGVQNTKDGTDPYELAKSLPFSKLPFLIPAINGLD